MTDEDLMVRLQRGEISALEELYARYAKKLTIFIRHTLQNRHPEDIVQDVFTRVIEKAHQFTPRKAAFRTWLFALARNRCIDLLRREKKIQFQSIDQEMNHGESQSGKSSSDALIVQAVNDCIGELRKEEEREALILYYVSGKVYREIGEVVGKSISLVKKRIAAAKDKVKRCLERKGIDSFA